MQASYTKDFTHGSILKGMALFSLPLFFSNLLQAVYNIVDMIVVGQFVGKNGLSAVSIGGDVLSMLTFLAMGFSNAGQVIIAQNIGAGRREKVGQIVGNLFLFLFTVALALTLVCFQIRTQMLQWMNTPVVVWEESLQYVTVGIAGLLFIYGYNAVSAVLRGMGDSRHPFLFIATAAILNVVLDVLLVVRFQMGVLGVALATVLSQGVSFLWGMLFLIFRRKQLDIQLGRDALRPRKDILGSLLKLGLPMAIKSASITFSKLFVDASINAYGVIVSGVSGIESKLNLIINLFSNAVNTSASTFIGQNIGAEEYDRIPKIMKVACSITLTVAAALSLLLVCLPQYIFGIFTTDSEVLEACLRMIPLLIVVFFGSAMRAPCNALIDGSGNYKLNFVTAFLDGVVSRIGYAVLLGSILGFGWIGYLYGDALAGLTPVMIGGIYFLSKKWRTRKYVIQ